MEKENACTWNNSLHSETFTSINSPFSSILNSPPESVKSNESNDEQCANTFNYDDIDREQSYEYESVDEYALRPIKTTPDFVYPVTLDFEEIAKIASSDCTMISNDINEFVKSREETYMDIETPILGDDLMFGRLTNSQTILSNSFLNIKEETVTNDTVEMDKETVCDLNANIIPANIQPKMTATVPKNERKKLNLIITPPQLQHAIASNMSDNKSTNDTGVLSTPQITQNILDLEQDFLEKGKWDLVKYIDSDNVS